MGSYDNIVKIEEIRKKVEESDFLTAKQVLDTMDIKKVKNISDLNLMAEVFKENEFYDEAAELYLKIYEKSQTRKTIYNLVNISIKKGNAEEAQDYLEQYQKSAPEDFDRYVFQYKIDKMKGASYEQLIQTLETLKKLEYTEKWEYELAKLYYKAGMEEECIKECSDLILLFGEGAYVEKAKMLRSCYLGETGKEKIMEELKRRAGETDDNKEKEESPELENQQDIEQKAKMPEEYEEEICTGSDFMVEHETEEFEYELKNDVREMLTNEEYDESVEGELTVAHTASQNIFQEEAAATLQETYLEETAATLQETYLEETTSTLQETYLEEVALDADEEDIRLKQIAEELQINTDEIFGNFLNIQSVKKQLVKSLESILQIREQAILMIITGSEEVGMNTLSKNMALFMNRAGKIGSIAKITAEKLNSVNIESKRETLRGCCVVIHNSSELKHATIDGLLELIEYLHGEIAIIFEVDKKNMNKLFKEGPKLMDLLKIKIHLPQYSQEDLMGFAYACLKQKDYKLDSKAETLLQNRIIEIAKQSEPHRYLDQIYDLMQLIMNAVDIRIGKQMTKKSAQLIVLPEDFKA